MFRVQTRRTITIMKQWSEKRLKKERGRLTLSRTENLKGKNAYNGIYKGHFNLMPTFPRETEARMREVRGSAHDASGLCHFATQFQILLTRGFTWLKFGSPVCTIEE